MTAVEFVERLAELIAGIRDDADEHMTQIDEREPPVPDALAYAAMDALGSVAESLDDVLDEIDRWRYLLTEFHVKRRDNRTDNPHRKGA